MKRYPGLLSQNDIAMLMILPWVDLVSSFIDWRTVSRQSS